MLRGRLPRGQVMHPWLRWRVERHRIRRHQVRIFGTDDEPSAQVKFVPVKEELQVCEPSVKPCCRYVYPPTLCERWRRRRGETTASWRRDRHSRCPLWAHTCRSSLDRYLRPTEPSAIQSTHNRLGHAFTTFEIRL